MADSTWNKYGKIKDGLIEASFLANGPEVEYAHAYDVYNRDPAGDKYDLPMQAAIIGNRICIAYEGKPIAALPMGWTQFLHQVAQRGPINGTGFVRWMAKDNAFRVRLDLDEH